MTMTSKRLTLATILILGCSAVWGHPVGPNAGAPNPLTTEVTFRSDTVSGWFPDPVSLSGDPRAAPWIKRLIGPVIIDDPNNPPNPIPAVRLTLKERANVGQANDPGGHWKQWIEVIMTPGWEWASGGLQAIGAVPGGEIVQGILSDPNNDGFNEMITFTFAALYPGPNRFIVTEKLLECVAPNGCPQPTRQNPIVIHEWMEVPTPGVLWLMALGCVPFAWFARACRRGART